MRNDHRAHNQRRSYDRASQGDHGAQGRSFDKPRGPRNDKPRGPRKEGEGFKPRGPRKDDESFGSHDDKPRGFRKEGERFKPHSDNPRGPRKEREGFKPRGDKTRGPRSDRSYSDKSRDEKPRGPRPEGDSPLSGGAPKRHNKHASYGKRPTSARELALSAIHQLRERDAFAQDVIAKTIDNANLSREDRAFATRLVLGVVSMRGSLNEILDSYLDSPDDVSPAVRDALDLSVYEIIYLGKSPHAAVDQGVELVRSVAPKASGLANAVLRRVVRAKEAFPFGDPRKDLAAYARLHGFPQWLTERLLAELGGQSALDFMKASNEPAPVFVAVNAVKTDEAEVVAVLEAAHGDPMKVVVEGRKVAGCYRLSSGTVLLDGRVKRLINQGMLLVSDATSQAVAGLVVGDALPASFLEIGAGRATKTILDQSCAYRRFGAQIPDYATVDTHAFKTKLLRERTAQYGVEVADALTGDGTQLDEVVGDRLFDVVFIDAPCTGLGTLRRHPEIRWRLRRGTIAEQAELDAQLLESAAAHVAPGGTLAYATCTITHEENADTVQKFLASEAGSAFELIPYDNPELGIETPFFSVNLVPGGSDAHFLARMRKGGHR